MYKKAATLVFLVALVIALVSVPAAAQDENIQKVRSALKRGQYQTALGLADKILNEYPEWFWGYFWLGESQAGLKQYSKAVRSFSRSLDYAEDDDQRFMAKYKSAEASYKGGEYGDALKSIKSAERHKSSKYYRAAAGKLMMMEGYSYFNTGKYSDAIASFKPFVDSGKASPDILRAVAKCHQELGNNTQAINLIKQVVKADPKDLSAHKILVKSYTNDKKWDSVIAAADEAIKNFSRDSELFFLKGQAHFKLRQYNLAKAALKTSLEIKPSNSVRYLYAQVFLKTGDYYEATKQFNLAQKGFTKDADFYLQYAYAWIQWVPKDTENYTGTDQEGSFKTALANAEALLSQSRTLGGDTKTINGYMEIVNQKKERLEKGKFYTEEYEIFIDPDTGEIIKRKVGGGDN